MSTKIEWCDEVWNIVTGCTKVSSGCKHCYAERMSKRLAGRFGYPVDNPFQITLHPDWVRSIRDDCLGANVPFFFKQWGDGLQNTFKTKIFLI